MRINCFTVAIVSSILLILPIAIELYYVYEYFNRILHGGYGIQFAGAIFLLTILGLLLASIISFTWLCRGVK